MPYINGRYHINPIMGQALEAAREAEARLLALEQQTSRDAAESCDDSTGAGDSAPAAPSGDGPIHRVEIEATEVVPAPSGRATRGFVARVHRAPAVPDAASRRAAPSSAAPETHVFSDHHDLVNFLRDELARK